MRRLSGVLADWEQLPWPQVAEAARAVGPVVWEELSVRGMWACLPEHDQASVYWTMAEGHVVGCIDERWMRPEREGPRIVELREACDYFTHKCSPRFPTDYGRALDAETADGFADRFRKLPHAWQAEVMRRLMKGQDVMGTVCKAQQSINVLHHVHGISLAWTRQTPEAETTQPPA